MARKTSFYYAFLELPAEQRKAIIAVWDFCRAVDDAVDEGGENPREAICVWRRELAPSFRAQSGYEKLPARAHCISPSLRRTCPTTAETNCCRCWIRGRYRMRLFPIATRWAEPLDVLRSVRLG